MFDLVAINRKYEKIFRLIDIILFFVIFSLFILHIVTFYQLVPDNNLILIINPILCLIFLFILGVSIFYISKGKTKQVKDFALRTLGRCIAFSGVSLLIEFIIMIIFNSFDLTNGIFLLLGSIFFIFVLYGTYAFEGMFNLKFRKARRLMFEGKYGDALILFNELKAENYNYPSLYYNLALIYEYRDYYDLSLEYLNKLISINDKLKLKHDEDLCTYAHEHKAFVLRQMERYNEALEAIDKAILRRDDYAWSWSEKGHILSLLEEYDKSLYFFDKAIELNPPNKNALHCKADALINLERWDEADKITYFLLNINPDDKMALNLKTIIFIHTENYHKALKYIEKSLKIDSKDYNAWYNKGYVLFILNRYTESLIAFKEALKIDNNSSSLEYVGICLEELGKIDEAEKYYKKALSYYDYLLKKDNNDYYLLDKAFIFEKLGEFEKSLDICNGILKKDNENKDALLRKAYTLGVSGKIGESLKFFNKLLKLKLYDVKFILGNIGWILCENKKFEESLSYLINALELDPNDFDTLNSKGYALENLGNYQESLECYEKVLKLNPKDYHGLEGRERVLLKLKK